MVFVFYFLLFIFFFSAKIPSLILFWEDFRITQKLAAIVRTTKPIRRTGKTDEMDPCFSAYEFYYGSGCEVVFVALEFLASSTLKGACEISNAQGGRCEQICLSRAVTLSLG